MTEVYTLSVKCVGGRHYEEECIRVIEIAEDDSLHSLHVAIQKAVNFDCDHLYDFFKGRNQYSRQNVVEKTPGGNIWDSMDNDIDYDEIKLNEIYPLQNKKLYYYFDYGDSWMFEIRKKRIKKEMIPGEKYPRVIEEIGPAPLQYGSFKR